MRFIIFTLGLLIGSFLNVCIYRIPIGKSIAYPPSHCPKCRANLKPIDLIPLISFLWTRGRCRYCSNKISMKYPLVEILNAVIYLTLYLKFSLSILFVKYSILSSILIVVSFIDIEREIIPDEIVIFGLIYSFVLHTLYNFKGNLLNGTIGLVIGGGIFLIIALATNAMGGGDIKLMGMLGFILGYKNIILVTFLSFIIGAVVSLVLIALKIKGRKDFIPFGPFIAMATLVTVYYGSEIISWYLTKLII
ncbi:prepilin peptidase [Tepidibacter thalassicus]|uniref:Type 4 prepilin peptidase 1 Aspartic peptidase. MEROPS family A24A n=1 Tax=Tepidibacter thalassicus DSM 15285 TaxID=1123350 RepID=A0A1M5T6E8_9FIRM|nr:A24 family peptidase [Tepidibacter thalassicus]SHH46325.1 type 4 prepilin peptidase 1 Aspartic peptidase. MEROPS family A24A [Tepidibacter thalassicus DSM 15285]